MQNVARIVLAVGFLTSSAAVSLAQEGIGPQTSFVELMKRGYEIRGTSVAPVSEMSNKDEKYSPILITLQKGLSVAVCQFSWPNWSNMNKATLEDPKLCDVR